MLQTKIQLHPLVQWLQVDGSRLQLSLGEEKGLTFDAYSQEIESMLELLRDGYRPDQLCEKLPVLKSNESFVDALVSVLMENGMLISSDNFPKGTYAQLVALDMLKDVRCETILAPYAIRKIEVNGSGVIHNIAVQIADRISDEHQLHARQEGPCLQIYCSDTDGFRDMKVVNHKALEQKDLFTAAVWDGKRIRLGPFVIPGESACVECYRLRRLIHSEHKDEFEALNSGSPQDSGVACLVDPTMTAMIQFMLNRHITNIVQTAFHLTEPGEVLSWNPLEHAPDRGHVLKVPNCPQCARPEVRDALRSVRDLI